MRRLFGSATCVLAAALLATSAAAQEGGSAYGPEQGDWEFTLNGAGSNDNDFENGGFNASASIGNYITRELLLGVRQSVTFADSGGDSSTFASTRGFVNYHFDFDALQPFVGGSIGAIYGDDVEDDWIAGFEGGVKWYALQKTFIFAIMEYQWPPEESLCDDGMFVYGLGIGFNF